MYIKFNQDKQTFEITEATEQEKEEIIHYAITSILRKVVMFDMEMTPEVKALADRIRAIMRKGAWVSGIDDMYEANSLDEDEEEEDEDKPKRTIN